MSAQPLYTKKVLQNGLTLLTVPIETAASVTMSVFVKAGSRYEKLEQNGMAHFLEHLHFKGSAKYPTAKKLSEVIDAVGGEFNANTGKEHTQYYIRAAHEHLPLVFGVLTDMVQNPLFDEKEIEREKGVIIEEINMYKDTPQIHVETLFEELLWEGCALGRDIAGTPEVIRSVTREDVLKFREKFYQPGNTIIAVAGQFDADKLEKLVNEHWGKLPNKKFGSYAPVVEKQRNPRLVVKNKLTEQGHMILGFGAYPYRSKHNFPLRLLSATLGGGMSSRMFIRIRERLGLAYYISTSYNNYLDAGSFIIQSGLKVSSAPQALEVILDELRKVRKDGISSAELKKAKDYIKGKIALAMEDPQDKMEWYLGQEAFLGKIRTIKQTFEELDKVTLDDINKVAHDILKNENMDLAVIGPYADESVFAKKLEL